MSEHVKSPARRALLGYCGASVLLMGRFATVWANGTGTPAAAAIEHALRALHESLDGDLLLPADPQFEPSRRIGWNVMLPERRPDMIVRAASQADVVRTLAFAREQSRQVAIRGGGHSWCASALREGGVLLDLGRLDAVMIDPAAATATVGPAVRGTQLLQMLAPHGLAFPVAHCPTVPMGGFLLNGGNGLNYNRWGSACSNVLAVDLVLADGRELTASAEAYPDLFWAARGAGPGFFAVATRFHLALRPLPRAITLSHFVFPNQEIPAACRLVDDLSARVARDVSLVLGIGSPPPGLAGAGGAVASVLGVAFVDTSDEGAAMLEPVNSDPRVKRALSSTINAPSDFNGIHGAVGAALPGGHRYAVDNVWSNQPLSTLMEGFDEHYARAPSKVSNIIAPCFHPEYRHEGTAHSMWGRQLVYHYTVWTDPSMDEANQAWHAEAMSRLDPHMVGRYVGEADLTRPAAARQCYAPAAWERLRALRAIYDPHALFFDYLGLG